MRTTVTKPCKLQDPEEVKQVIDAYFRDREEQQEVRELKNGDKRVYRIPPSIYSLCKRLGISEDTFANYVNPDARTPNSINPIIVGLLADAKRRIVEELYEGLALGYWNERLILAQLAKFGVIGSDDGDKHITISIQGKESWSE